MFLSLGTSKFGTKLFFAYKKESFLNNYLLFRRCTHFLSQKANLVPFSGFENNTVKPKNEIWSQKQCF
jgi:hypothetical protein